METEVKAKVEQGRDDAQTSCTEDPIVELGTVSKDTRSEWFGPFEDIGIAVTWG